jgi:hypothetical protein
MQRYGVLIFFNQLLKYCLINRGLDQYLIYNEFKKDFSYIKQGQIVKEIEELEKNLTVEQKENGQKEAEKLLGRKLKNMENLYKAEL